MSRYSTKNTITAKCPRCEKRYKAHLDVAWVGRGVPRLICPACHRTMESCYDLDLARQKRERETSWCEIEHPFEQSHNQQSISL